MRAGTAPDAIVDTSSDAIAEAAHHLVSSRRVVPGLTVEPDGKARSCVPLAPVVASLRTGARSTQDTSPGAASARHWRAIPWPLTRMA